LGGPEDEAGGAMGMTRATVGDRVRSDIAGWTGTVRRVGRSIDIAEIEPDGGSGPRWFNLEDFTLVSDYDQRAVPVQAWRGLAARQQQPADDLVRRYLNDARFHQVVTYQGQLLAMGNTQADLKDAGDLAARIEQERAAGDTCGKGQTDAQERRGTHEAAEPEPEGPASRAPRRT
jgi:hypothetical protein